MRRTDDARAEDERSCRDALGPGPGCGMRGFWIVSGTGYTLGIGRTMDDAWQASAKLVRGLVERDVREELRVERIKFEMGAVG